jgi:hypothetical protein
MIDAGHEKELVKNLKMINLRWKLKKNLSYQ